MGDPVTALLVNAGLAFASRVATRSRTFSHLTFGLFGSPPAKQRPTPIDVMAASTTEPRRYIYGEAKLSGPLAFVGTSGPNNEWLHYVVVLAAHEVDAIGDVYLDNKLSTDFDQNYIKVFRHLGQPGQVADADLVASVPGVWDDSHKGTGIAYIHVKLKRSDEVFPEGPPSTISAVVRGKKVYDPRTGTTAWSDNPALCLRDYLLNVSNLGLDSSRIDDTFTIAAANICDETVTIDSGTEKRYTCNGTVTATDTPKASIDALLSSMGGRLAYSQGRYRMFAAAYDAPTATLDESFLRDAVSVQFSTRRRERFNVVKGTYLDKANGYQVTDFPNVESQVYQADDGGELIKDVSYPMTTSQTMAQRLAKIELERSRMQTVITMPCNFKALKVGLWDTVYLSLDQFGWYNKVFRVIGYTFSAGGVDLTLQEESASVYGWTSADGTSSTTIPGVVFPQQKPETPSGLSAAPLFGGNALSWTEPDDPAYYVTEVWASPDSTFSSAVKVGEVKGSYFVHQTSTTQYYYIRAKSRTNTYSAFYPATTGAGVASTPEDATVGAPPGTPVGNTDASVVEDYANRAGLGLDASGTITQPVPVGAIQPNAITATEIADGSISTPKLAANAVTANEIAAGSVTANKVAANAITTGAIAAGAITSDKIAANAVTANHISVGSLSAISATMGTVTGGTFQTAASGARAIMTGGDTPFQLFDAGNNLRFYVDAQGGGFFDGGLAPETIKDLSVFSQSVLDQLIPGNTTATSGGTESIKDQSYTSSPTTYTLAAIPSGGNQTDITLRFVDSFYNQSGNATYTAPSYTVEIRRNGTTIYGPTSYTGWANQPFYESETGAWMGGGYGITIDMSLADAAPPSGDNTYSAIITRTGGNYNAPVLKTFSASEPLVGADGAVDWSKVYNTPTTLAGYGITDAASASHNHDGVYAKLSGADFTGTLTVSGSTVWHAGNDGSGSGLDADLLDGYHASSFAKLTGADFTGTLTVSGNTVWHAGNDGSGSGLDADTLDGFHASSFALSSHGHDTLADDYLTNHRAYTNNDFKTAGFQVNHLDYSSAVKPSGVVDGYVFTLNYDSSLWAGQGFFDPRNNSMWIRCQNNGTWQPWEKVWHSGNDGAGSGLDADLLDGYHASSFAKLTGATFTGAITTTSTSAAATYSYGGFSVGSADGRGLRFWNSDSYKIYMSSDTGEPYGVTELVDNTDYNMYFRMNGAGRGFVFYNLSDSSTAAAQITGDGWIYARQGFKVGTTGYNVWHSGNDGSGSGLDADLLDGYHASSFAQLSGANFTGSLSVNGNAVWDTGSLLPEIVGGVKSVSGGDDWSFFPRPKGGEFSKVGDCTGHLKITLPVSWTSHMLSFWVDVFNYSTGKSVSFRVGGYNYSGSGSWVNVSVDQVGGLEEYTVYFGHDGSKCCIWIGTTSTVWEYPKVVVRDLMVGYTSVSDSTWNQGWAVDINTTSRNTTSTSRASRLSHSGEYTRVRSGYGYVDIGPGNSSWCHFATDRPEFYFNKRVQANGGFKIYSDLRMKTNIREFFRPSVSDLRLSIFDWKDPEREKDQIGYIAQEVQEVLPEAVSEGVDGMLSVDIDAVLAAKVEALEAKVRELEALIEELKA